MHAGAVAKHPHNLLQRHANDLAAAATARARTPSSSSSSSRSHSRKTTYVTFRSNIESISIIESL